MKATDLKRPRRLDLNAPLLSTRRPYLPSVTTFEISRTSSLCGSCDRVPFLWEQSPGKPKDSTSRGAFENKALPLPKPPPIRWQEEEAFPDDHTHNCNANVDDNDEGHNNEEYDDDDDGDDDDDDDDASFSDAIDLLSLVESLNISSDKKDKENVRDDPSFESDSDDNNGSLSPNYMIQRFLPAATALAESSVCALAMNKDPSTSVTRCSNEQLGSVYCEEKLCAPRVAGEAYSSSKGCGLEILFPWRVKHRLCGVKSPVRRVRPRLKPQLSPRDK